MFPLWSRKVLVKLSDQKFGSASHIIWVFCVWIHHNLMLVARCKCPKTDTLFTRKGTAALSKFFTPQVKHFLEGATYSKSLMQQRNVLSSPFTPSHQYPYSPYSSLYVSIGLDKENLFYHQSFSGWQSFPLFLWYWWMIQQYYCKDNLDAGHS